MKSIKRGDFTLPYTEIEMTQHTMKIYAPQPASLRVEVKIDRMQFLEDSRPRFFADLVQPVYAHQWVAKLLNAFDKVIWQCPNLNPNDLAAADRDLYLRGSRYDYWQVKNEGYVTPAEFKRVEKQRSREKDRYNNIVRRHWPDEAPAHIRQRIQTQLDCYAQRMQTSIYQTLLDICLERWHYVGNLPECERLPNRLKLPSLSEIYPLYLGRIPTTLKRPSSQLSLWTPPVNELVPKSGHYKTWLRNHYGHTLQVLRKRTNSPGGALYSADKIASMLSVKTRLALAYGKTSFAELQQDLVSQPLPLLLLLQSGNRLTA